MDREMLEFFKAALSGGVASPLCSEYKSEWRKCGDDKEKLIRFSLSQQALPYVATYAHMNNSFTKDYVKKAFGEYINGRVFEDCDGVSGYKYALYVDRDCNEDIDVFVDVCSVMWTVGSNIVIPKTKCPVLYISNRSNVHLVCEGNNNVVVKLFDESKVTVEDCDSDSKVIVYKYGRRATVETGKFCLSEPRIFTKELRL